MNATKRKISDGLLDEVLQEAIADGTEKLSAKILDWAITHYPTWIMNLLLSDRHARQIVLERIFSKVNTVVDCEPVAVLDFKTGKLLLHEPDWVKLKECNGDLDYYMQIAFDSNVQWMQMGGIEFDFNLTSLGLEHGIKVRQITGKDGEPHVHLSDRNGKWFDIPEDDMTKDHIIEFEKNWQLLVGQYLKD